MSVFVHEKGLCESSTVGDGTRVWAFAHVLPGAQLGKDCNVCDNVFIENDVVVGDRVTLKCGVQLWDGITLEDDVFVGPNATFTNDPFPRSKQYRKEYPRTRVCRGASIGANATLLPGLTIGQYAMIGAGSVVTRSVPPYAIVVGNPGRITGYASNEHPTRADEVPLAHSNVAARMPTDVRNVALHTLPFIEDIRGNLSVGEVQRHVPFEVRRYFLVFDVPSVETRGEHAHIKCEQFLVCVRGSVRVVADDGDRRQEFTLDRPNKAIHLGPMVWGIQYRYSADAVLLVLASEHYDAADYIRSYDAFVAGVRSSPSP